MSYNYIMIFLTEKYIYNFPILYTLYTNLQFECYSYKQVPDRFKWVVEQTFREFFKSVQVGKDGDPSWKKQIYKVIARLDDYVPEFFKSRTFLDQLE